MAETYSGFVAPKRVDWEALSTKLAEKVTGVGERIQKERVDLDKIASDNIAKMDEIEQSKNQTFGKMVLDFQGDGRNMVNAWNKLLKDGQLSPAEYRKKINNLNEYTGILAGSAKNFDARIQEVMKRQEEGVATAFELELLNEFGSLSEMKDAKFNISQDGSIMYSKINPVTGAIEGQLKDVRALNLPQNMVDSKVVLTDSVKELTKNWNMYETFADLGQGRTLTIDSVRNQPRYTNMKATVIQSITTNPRRALSILADNGDMIPVFYYTEDERKQKIDEAEADVRELNRIAGNKDTTPTKEQLASIEFNMVKKVKSDDGTINPELTKAQRDKAELMASDEIDGQMEMNMSGTTRDVPRGDGAGKTPKEQGFDTYKAIKKAWDLSKTSPVTSQKMLTNLTAGRYDIVWGEGGLKVRGYLDDGTVDTKNPIATVTSTEQLAPFIYGTTDAAGVDTSIEQFNKEREEYKKRFGGGSTTPKKITQAEFDKKWATLKPGETLVGTDGETYKKK